MTHSSIAQTPHECAICLIPLDNPDTLVQIIHSEDVAIPHIFHRDCIEQWLALKNNCPTCRGNVVEIEIIPVCTADPIPAIPEPSISVEEENRPVVISETAAPPTTFILQGKPFWTHRKVISMACVVTALTLRLTTSAMQSHLIALPEEPALSNLALKFTRDNIAKHPKICAAALASLAMTPEILRMLKTCLWDHTLIRAAMLSSIGTIVVINFKLPQIIKS